MVNTFDRHDFAFKWSDAEMRLFGSHARDHARHFVETCGDPDLLSRRNPIIPELQAALAVAKRWTPAQGLISRHSLTPLTAAL